MSGPDPAPAGRRAYDRDIDPMIEVVLDQRIAETRHMLRNEFTAALVDMASKLTQVANAVAEGNLQSTREHAENKACIEELRRDVAQLKPLFGRVNRLERHDDVGEAREQGRDEILAKIDRGRKWMIGTAVALAGVIVAATAVLLQHS